MIDYMIMEAVAVKVRMEDQKAEKEAEVDAWKKDRSNLEQHR